MRVFNLRNKSNKELIRLKKQLEFDLCKSNITDDIKNKEANINVKSAAEKGQKTSLKKGIRRTIAQINTLLRERELEK